MALFPGKADDALSASVQMLHTLNEYNFMRINRGDFPVDVGIGLNTGDMMLGTVGEHDRMEGTVIGDTVNLAARIHLALAESTRNPLMVWLYRHINDVRGHAQWSIRKDKILTPDRITEYNRQHRALFAAIASRDVQGAMDIMTRHLEKAEA